MFWIGSDIVTSFYKLTLLKIVTNPKILVDSSILSKTFYVPHLWKC